MMGKWSVQVVGNLIERTLIHRFFHLVLRFFISKLFQNEKTVPIYTHDIPLYNLCIRNYNLEKALWALCFLLEIVLL